MAEARARLFSLDDVRASVKRMQAEGERLVGRLRRDARQFVTRDGRRAVDGVLALTNVRKLQADVRKRAEQAVRTLEHRRSRVVNDLQHRFTRLAHGLARQIGAATVADLEDIKRRLSQIERRLESISKEKSGKHEAA